MHKPYHHGNLRNTLIEAGIELINHEGGKNFSLRKVASLCGVSEAAPYSHFENKEALLKAMQDHIQEKLMKVLEDTIQSSPDSDNTYLLIQMGKSYIMFFLKDPQYFPFLCAHTRMKINLSMDTEGTNNFPPFELFKSTSLRVLRKNGFPEVKLLDIIISMFATVHGLASIATMPNVHYSEDWEAKIEDIIWKK
ncbi:TetR/AcrR family transcriptional regulator [Sporolactobacillus pectinivorans]|uniref:TetR/AcrR family transcriptional regulator n=1 Tax=Sporolactobacillus pectinivorans TaxID=1591408 RepID=UPI000C25F0D1|nr:TetR/AcrR family transcriptional regulator [Sporolactobacillus pectinivorans]